MDEDPPFVDVPHWFTGDFVRVLRHHRVEFRICDGYERRRGSQDPDDCMDRLVFPRGHPEFVQTLLDSVKPPGCE